MGEKLEQKTRRKNFDNDNVVISLYCLCYKLSGRDDIVLTKISNRTTPGIMSTQTKDHKFTTH